MKPILLVLLVACGAPMTDCPSPFASMQAEAPDGCFDPNPSLAFLKAAGIHIDPSTVNLIVRDTFKWEEPGYGEISGLTSESGVEVCKTGWSLTHELLHVSERPNLTWHETWRESGFYALTNMISFVENGETGAWGYYTPCVPPNLPPPMQISLRAAGYPVDEFLQKANEVCQ